MDRIHEGDGTHERRLEEPVLTIYKATPYFAFELLDERSIVNLVESLCKRPAGSFSVLEKTTGERIDEAALEAEQPSIDHKWRPLIGWGGERSYPMVSDPSKVVLGGFLILLDTKQLIYKPRAVSLGDMRDAYTWAYSPYQYYVPVTAGQIIQAFLARGYKPMRNDEPGDYMRDTANIRAVKNLNFGDIEKLFRPTHS